jgi:ferredoxin
MVLYFSATGNTRYIADNLAGLLDDTSLNLLPRIRNRDFSAIHSEKPFVICAPTYVCEMPRFLAAYLKKIPLTGSRDVWFIFTSGGYAGCSGVLAKKLVRKKKMLFRGYTEFKMPRNYIANNWYPELERVEIERRISDSSKKLSEVAEAIRNRGRLKSRHVWLSEKITTVPFNPVWCRFKQPTVPFHAKASCISCGRCVQLCPVKAITMVNGKPLWTKESCAHCMSCIQNCPVEAIEYGNVTQSKKRYLFQKYRYVLEGNES